MNEIECSVLVVGGGPGGYTAAIRGAQRGLPTVLVDNGGIGGTCLRIGCIPSKALIHVAHEYATATVQATGRALTGVRVDGVAFDLTAAVAWKDDIVARLTAGVSGLVDRAGVQVLGGWATILDGKTVLVDAPDGPVRVRTEHLVLATGSVPAELPGLQFGGAVVSSTEALALDAVPERMCVVGAGYIGLELGTVFAKLGSTVTFVEYSDTLLPGFDVRLTRPVRQRLDELGAVIRTGSEAVGYSDGQVHAKTRDGEPFTVDADVVLVAVGRWPRVDGWGLERLPIDRDGRFVKINGRCATSMRGVWAVGDLTGEPMLAHRAIAQAEIVIDAIAGGSGRWDHLAVPCVVFCDPQIVSVGLTADAARAEFGDVVDGTFPFTANGRALGSGHATGFVQIVARPDDHAVLGVHAVGADVSELATSFSLAVELQARLEDVTATIHAHPTRGEAFAEASLAALGRPLHR